MEQALFISTIDNAHYLTEDFTRLYFGQEFCERLLPDRAALDGALNLAVQRRLPFTFVTPYVTNRGLEKLEHLLEHLQHAQPDAEVVFNDWGVLHALRGEWTNLRPVLGRLLNKMKRGPRIMNIIDKLPDPTQAFFRGCALDVPAFCAFLKQHGITRVEFDNMLQGITLDAADGDIHRSLYLPFVFVSTTRFCLSANCDNPAYRDRIGVFPCGRECRRYAFHLFNPVIGVPLIRKGNAIFFLNETIPDIVSRRQVDRIVIQPEIPI